MTSTATDRTVLPRQWPLRINGLLFDLDGTLVDTVPDLTTATNQMLCALDRAPVTADQIRAWVGDGARRLVARALAVDRIMSSETTEVDAAYRLFGDYYARSVCVDSVLYPGVTGVLRSFQQNGLAMACVTNKPRAFTTPLLEQLGLSRFFGVVVCGDDLPVRKPAPEPLLDAARRLAVPATNCALVGDSVNDIRAARAAGMPVFWAGYGYGESQVPAQLDPDAVLDSIAELNGLVTIGG